MKSLATVMLVPVQDVVKVERMISLQLFHDIESEKVRHDENVHESRNKKEGSNRWLLAGLATVAGGTVIGLTAGLAAPLVTNITLLIDRLAQVLFPRFQHLVLLE